MINQEALIAGITNDQAGYLNTCLLSGLIPKYEEVFKDKDFIHGIKYIFNEISYKYSLEQIPSGGPFTPRPSKVPPPNSYFKTGVATAITATNFEQNQLLLATDELFSFIVRDIGNGTLNVEINLNKPGFHIIQPIIKEDIFVHDLGLSDILFRVNIIPMASGGSLRANINIGNPDFVSFVPWDISIPFNTAEELLNDNLLFMRYQLGQ